MNPTGPTSTRGQHPPTPQVLRRRLLLASALGLLVLEGSGCSSARFYLQAARGQFQLLAKPKPTAQLLVTPGISAKLEQRFTVVEEILCYAEHQLGLPANGNYRKYLDLGRKHVVWNVEAAPEFSLRSKSWWYPFVGSLEYRGYFSEQDAQRYAESLGRKGFDTLVEGVDAYSTLGWFRDPLLNTFIYHPDPWLADLVFHELAHQSVFAPGDTRFNEAFATTVGEQGARGWLRHRGDLAQLANYEASLARNRQFVALVMHARQRLETLYGDVRDETGRLKPGSTKARSPSGPLRVTREQIIADLRRDYQVTRQQWNGAKDYDQWFSEPIGNAKINSVATYYDLVPDFERILASTGGDWKRFYAEVNRLAKMPKPDRHRILQNQARLQNL